MTTVIANRSFVRALDMYVDYRINLPPISRAMKTFSEWWEFEYGYLYALAAVIILPILFALLRGRRKDTNSRTRWLITISLAFLVTGLIATITALAVFQPVDDLIWKLRHSAAASHA